MAKLDSIAMLAELDGAVLVDKPANMASHDVVKVVKQHFNLVKTGHGGTLEPNATGLFILLVGDGTRFASDLMGRDRAFTATIRLGRVTDTQDREGRTFSESPFDGVTRESLEAALPEFRGDIFQTPPAFSTIKMTGHPGYDIVETPVRRASCTCTGLPSPNSPRRSSRSTSSARRACACARLRTTSARRSGAGRALNRSGA